MVNRTGSTNVIRKYPQKEIHPTLYCVPFHEAECEYILQAWVRGAVEGGLEGGRGDKQLDLSGHKEV